MRTLVFRSTGTVLAALLFLAGCSTTGAVDEPGLPDPAAPTSTTAEPTVPTPPADPAYRPGDRPNIVLITTDDQTMTDMAFMPKTRRVLGDAGITFPNSINPHPLCCPARAEILTGQYAQNNGVRSNKGKYGGYQALDPTRTVATWLDDTGYQTAFVGKYLNMYAGREVHEQGNEPGWDIWNPTIKGVYSYYGFTNWENGTPRTYTDIHNADYVGDKTVEYIHRFTKRDKPFFIWASQVAPHGACSPREETGKGCWVDAIPAHRHADLFADTTSPSLDDPAFNEADVSDKSGYIRDLNPVTETRVNHLFHARIRSLQAVDEAVADTIAALRVTGELGNTVVAFTSDNGFLLGEHRKMGKNVPYAESVSVPLLVRGPGIPHGVTRPQTVSTIDLAPTFAALAHATPTLTTDGRNLTRVFGSDRAAGTDTALIQSGPETESENAYGWAYRGVRTRRYTYVVWYEEGFVELYDRKTDPAEMTNRAGDPAYARVQTELARRAQILADCTGAVCRTDFGPVPEPQPTR